MCWTDYTPAARGLRRPPSSPGCDPVPGHPPGPGGTCNKRPLGARREGLPGSQTSTPPPIRPSAPSSPTTLAEGLTTRKQARQKAEKKTAKEGGDTPPPDWDTPAPRGRGGAAGDPPHGARWRGARWCATSPVRRRRASTGWPGDLRYPSTRAETGRQPGGPGGNPFGAGGPLAAPGTYSVSKWPSGSTGW